MGWMKLRKGKRVEKCGENGKVVAGEHEGAVCRCMVGKGKREGDLGREVSMEKEKRKRGTEGGGGHKEGEREEGGCEAEGLEGGRGETEAVGSGG